MLYAILGDFLSFRQGPTGVECEIYIGKLLARAFEQELSNEPTTSGVRCGVHHDVLAITAEGTSSYTNHHISTSTVVQTKKTAHFESYAAQRFYGIRMVPHPLQDPA